MAHPVAFQGRARNETTRPRAVLILGIVLVVAIATVVAIGQLGGTTGSSSVAPYNGMALSPAQPLPDLELDRAAGGRWSTGDADGRISLFFFGYTHCPDVCPMTLSRASQIRSALGDRSDDVAFYFVTVDPERDTRERLANYVAAFDPAIVGLTGTATKLDAAHEAFGVQAQKQEIAGASNYAVDHTATSYLVDREGRIAMMYTHDATAGEIIEDLQRLVD